jgi:hypothetical protein
MGRFNEAYVAFRYEQHGAGMLGGGRSYAFQPTADGTGVDLQLLGEFASPMLAIKRAGERGDLLHIHGCHGACRSFDLRFCGAYNMGALKGSNAPIKGGRGPN